MKDVPISQTIVETERLLLRFFTENDYEHLYKLHTDKDVMKLYPGGIKTKEQIQQDLDSYISHQQKYAFSKWVCILKETEEFLGRAGIAYIDSGEVEVGYLFLPEYWGNGYATEALRAILKWTFINTNISKLIGFTHTENIASKMVMKKSGMNFYKRDLCEGLNSDFYSIVKPDLPFPKNPSS